MNPELRTYWRRRGKRYYREFQRKSESERNRYSAQELMLQRALGALQPIGSILELACGFGRMTAVLNRSYPSARIVACDLSPSQIRRARSLVPGVDFRVADALALDLQEVFDLVLASEFFMHLQEAEFLNMMDRVSAWSGRYVVNIDYTGEGVLFPSASGLVYQFRHNYPSAYGQRGFRVLLATPLQGQTIFVAERAPEA